MTGVETGALPVASSPRPTLVTAITAVLRTPRGLAGGILVAIILLLVVVGPFFAPHDPQEIIGSPLLPAGADGAVLGTDYLGHDTLSRFLYGGRLIMLMSLISAVLGVGTGVMLGVIAGYLNGRLGGLIMRFLDVLLCFPALVLALLVASMLGTSEVLVTIIVALSHVPRTARIVHAATLRVAERDFIAYAETLGASRRTVMLREFLPNLSTYVALELGLRMTWSIGTIASLSYLGLGVQSPASDWGLMTNENQQGIMLVVWPVLLPVLAICAATVGVNLLTDAFGQHVAGIDRIISEGRA